MAAITPILQSFNDECNVEFNSGAVNASEGDWMTYAAMAAVLQAEGYAWSEAYAKLTKTYATIEDARAAFRANGNPSNWNFGIDRVYFASNYSTPQPAYTQLLFTAHAEVLHENPRAISFKLRHPQEEQGVADSTDAYFTLKGLAALMTKFQGKSVFAANYSTYAALVEAIGDLRPTWSVGYGAAPNIQPDEDTYDGVVYARGRIDSYNGSPGYGYLTIDLGHSIVR